MATPAKRRRADSNEQPSIKRPRRQSSRLLDLRIWEHLVTVAKNGRVEELKNHEDRYFSELSPDGETLLYIAARAGHIAFMQELLKSPAVKTNIDTEQTSPKNLGLTALFAAVMNMHMQAAKTLLEEGADPNKTPTKGEFTGLHPLFLAMHIENPGMIALFTKANPNVEITSKDEGKTHGMTALYYAATKGYIVAIAVLLHAGADINHQLSQGPNQGKSALFAAVEAKRIEVVKILVGFGADVDQEQRSGLKDGLAEGQTPLFQAAYQGYLEIAKVLVAGGATIDKKLTRGKYHRFTAGRIANSMNNYKIARFLKEGSCQ